MRRLFNDESNGLDGCYTYSDKEYYVKDLIEISKDLEVFEIPLKAIDLSRMPWSIDSIKDFVHHSHRMSKSDLKHPIILDVDGYICDGWHRLAKCLIEGKETIKAVRLTVMPEPILK